METNHIPLRSLLSRLDTSVDFLGGAISQNRALDIKLERCEDELKHRRDTGRHLADLRPTAEIIRDINVCRVMIRQNMVEFVETLGRVQQRLEGFDPRSLYQTSAEVDVQAQVA